jgi:glycosyltransferase involved in cell wall biosynthesis
VHWLVAVRNCGEADRRLLEGLLERAGVRGEFDLRYNLPFTEMKGLMAQARLAFLLYPSDVNYASRIPIRIFEYMAAGLPFVASDHPTTRLFTEGAGVAVLTEAGEPAAFAEALDALLDDPERQREMSGRGPRLVLERYNWEVESRRLVELYDELLGGKARRSASPVETGGFQPSTDVAREES